jgi:solute:Na+ symporter, SSS family
VTVIVSMVTQPKPVEELQGLVYGMANVADELSEEERAWYRKPSTLAIGVLLVVLVLSILFV